MGRRHRRQPEGHLQLLQGRRPEHARRPLRTDRQPVAPSSRPWATPARPTTPPRRPGSSGSPSPSPARSPGRPSRSIRGPRLYRHVHDGGPSGPVKTAFLTTSPGPVRGSRGGCPGRSGSSVRTTPPTSPARSSTSTAACTCIGRIEFKSNFCGGSPWRETNC